MQRSIVVKKVNYLDSVDRSALVAMLDMYACDPMGGGEPLALEVKSRLCDDLAKVPGAVSWLAWLDQQPIGLLNAMPGYSTFKARPLMNVHDIAVDPGQRGRGVGRALLQALEDHAKDLGCCKLTLEVLSGNGVAKQAYARFGFEQYALGAATGQALFMQKPL